MSLSKITIPLNRQWRMLSHETEIVYDTCTSLSFLQKTLIIRGTRRAIFRTCLPSKVPGEELDYSHTKIKLCQGDKCNAGSHVGFSAVLIIAAVLLAVSYK
jgi:hypothetical protein